MGGFASLFSLFFMFFDLPVSVSVDSLNVTQLLRDGETLVSADGSYELGFFSPSSRNNKRYLGLWFKKSTSTIAWVANREVALNGSTGSLRISNKGTLDLVDGTGATIWSSNSSSNSSGSVRNPVAQLLDSGNLVVKDAGGKNTGDFIWQSFDHMGDTFLPGMKIGWNLRTGLDNYMSSWKTVDDPAQGNFSFRFDIGGFPELVISEGSTVLFRSGPWNGVSFSGIPELKQNSIFTFDVVFNENEVYWTWTLVNNAVYSWMRILPDGTVQRFAWNERTNDWLLYPPRQLEHCDQYAQCGVYGSCNGYNYMACNCLDGFKPKIQAEWNMGDGTSGCVREIELNCSTDGFLSYTGVKLPDARHKVWFNTTMDLEYCRKLCIKNCSCTAYTNLDITGDGSGCLLWFADLIDIREFTKNVQVIYVRMAASEIDRVNTEAKSKKKKRGRIIRPIVFSVAALILCIALSLVYVWRKKYQKRLPPVFALESSSKSGDQMEDVELPFFDFTTVALATNNFSTKNKLGQGGFGSVYKGVLKDGKEIAVKRLSKGSRQGVEEFKTEVIHIVKLQHRNLVKILGCCIEKDEMLLIYEFMPNKSLDFFIFDKNRSNSLNWAIRCQIINGIARGILYLHQDSRLRIIHRDLKADNILLDNEMNPKISDFGLARSFPEVENEARTMKVVGTYGYMSPEYAINGLYSTKSDVFSFGVLVLEIVSGKRNRGFTHPDHCHNLLGHAWKLHTEGNSLELIAESIQESCNISEALRSVHIGLLCVQRRAEDRPSMSSVVFMLSGESLLPQPKQPGFYNEMDMNDANSLSLDNASPSIDTSITLLDPR